MSEDWLQQQLREGGWRVRLWFHFWTRVYKIQLWWDNWWNRPDPPTGPNSEDEA